MPLVRQLRRSTAPVRTVRGDGAAFTLLEVLAAMAILAVLAALGSSALQSAKQRAASARAKSELAALAQALEGYKQHYGDYPQTGTNAGAPIIAAAIGRTQAQALLLNALLGVYSATNLSTPINGPRFVELAKFTLEIPLTAGTQATFGEPVGNPPAKQPVANALLDPWGRRYLYYYKTASLGGRPPSNTWRAPAYVLYSAGPDGQHLPPNLTTGLFAGAAQTSGLNADNIYAHP